MKRKRKQYKVCSECGERKPGKMYGNDWRGYQYICNDCKYAFFE